MGMSSRKRGRVGIVMCGLFMANGSNELWIYLGFWARAENGRRILAAHALLMQQLRM